MEYIDLGIFFLLVPLLLVIDLNLFGKSENNIISLRHSLLLSLWYILAALAYGLLIWHDFGAERALNYYTVYVIEKSLSLDNLFVFSVIFSAFAIPKEYEHRVLVWGIIGVIIMRGTMIVAGTAIVHEFEWVLYIFALILIFTGIKIFISKGEDVSPEDFQKKKFIVFLKKHLPFTPQLHGKKFFVRQSELTPEERTHNPRALFVATPLFLTLIVIEVSDLIFAIDSIPAAFAVTTDTFVVFTSNIFAVMGLRALYFAVENVLDRFEKMKYALSIVLIFIGGKVFYNTFFPHISPALSLAITLGVLTVGFLYAWIDSREKESRL
ncbi:MAG: TerC/Alx family metal homeostasis membrane protein [Alphaproteobacteria bacterium]|nr:TerC/Alx family metal homeostasis membrane protein [Alphaproteobacteria bacterium]